MRQWTHVAGIIRLDNMGINIIRFPGRDVLEEILKSLANAIKAESDARFDLNFHWDTSHMVIEITPKKEGDPGSIKLIP